MENKRILYALAAAVVAIGIIAAMLIQASQTSVRATQPQQALREESAAESKPNEIQYRTGIPTLTSFQNSYSGSISDYYQINQGQYSYLDRAIQKGTTLLSNSEMDEYFKTFSDKGYKFAVTSLDGTTKYYTINYFEPPISLDRHNVLISILDKADSSRQALPAAEAGYLSAAIDKPYRWVQIDDNAATAIVKQIAADGYELNTTTSEGQKTVRIMYIGPLSEELKLPEFQAMYGQVAASAGGQ